MNLIHIRYGNSLLAELARIRDKQERLQRLLKDRPTGHTILNRERSSIRDRRRRYWEGLLRSTVVATLLILVAFIAFPEISFTSSGAKVTPQLIQLEDIPETSQKRSVPRSSRPSVPLGVEEKEELEDVTIEITDLVLDRIPLDLPIGRKVAGTGNPPEEEEIVELWKVEQKPELIRHVAPVYPKLARRAGIEGVIYVNLLVGKDGKVQKAEIVRGLEIFHGAALDAVKNFVFSPGIQNDKTVKVWMTVPIHFTLVDNRRK